MELLGSADAANSRAKLLNMLSAQGYKAFRCVDGKLVPCAPRKTARIVSFSHRLTSLNSPNSFVGTELTYSCQRSVIAAASSRGGVTHTLREHEPICCNVDRARDGDRLDEQLRREGMEMIVRGQWRRRLLLRW
jgi:hypothetical protein